MGNVSAVQCDSPLRCRDLLNDCLAWVESAC